MSLLSTYTQFLASPTSSVLAHDASINYIPTLTTINEPAGVIKHLAAQAKVLTKKSEKVISSVEGQHSLCIEFGTTIEFLTGGGALLPGLDDNFLTDKIVVLPMVCFPPLQRLCLKLIRPRLDPRCRLQPPRQGPPYPYLLGPRLPPQEHRCHWLARPQLADSRWQGSDSSHVFQHRCGTAVHCQFPSLYCVQQRHKYQRNGRPTRDPILVQVA
jgi:hypothetical protein